MNTKGRRKCRHCKTFFIPDPRNRHHQRYCGQPACRRESKAESQRKWEGQSGNRDYYCGSAKATKVRAWRAAHPGYWKRRRQKSDALPDVLITQPSEPKSDVTPDAEVALPDVWLTQDPLVVGLIAHFIAIALPEDIAVVTNRFVAHGLALQSRSKHENRKTNPLDRPTAPLPGAVLVR